MSPSGKGVIMENLATTSIPRFRTIKSCLAEIQKWDKDTAVTEHFIRNLIKSEKVVYYKSGNKALVSLGSVLNYLGMEGAQQ